GMGATQTQTVWKVLLPTAMPGILTGVMLAVARAAGETAPLLFTAMFSYYWPDDPMERTSSLAGLICKFYKTFHPNHDERVWTAALVLVVIVLIFNLTGQALAKKKNY